MWPTQRRTIITGSMTPMDFEIVALADAWSVFDVDGLGLERKTVNGTGFGLHRPEKMQSASNAS